MSSEVPSSPSEESNVPANPFLDFLEKMYERFMSFVKIQENDPILLYTFKLGMRLVGILIMLALSPIIILGFFIALIIAS